MTDSMEPRREDRIDRYSRGELSTSEARELAQQSLDDPELFEDLTCSALAKAAVSARPAADRLEQARPGEKIFQFPGKVRFIVAGAAATAAILLVSLYFLRFSSLRQNRSPLSQNKSHETAPVSNPRPALASLAQPGQPVLLASDLESGPARREGTPVFRGAEPGGRDPRPVGSIVSIEGDVADVDLGSLDGLAKGTELRVFRGERFTHPIGRWIVTTVFRERARGRILAGQEIQVNSRVQAPAPVYLGALWQQVDALSSRGDSAAARAIAEKAAVWAQTTDVPRGQRRTAFERLAQLEYQAGELQAAEQHYQAVVDSLNAEPQPSVQEQSVAFNNLAVLRLLRGNYDGAEAPLSEALSKSLKTDSTSVRSLNNLGVLAELRGNPRKAETLYADALRAFAGIRGPSSQERVAVETNLARVRSSR
jgi:hypothetical protein